jgi:hypothetical protein
VGQESRTGTSEGDLGETPVSEGVDDADVALTIEVGVRGQGVKVDSIGTVVGHGEMALEGLAEATWEGAPGPSSR